MDLEKLIKENIREKKVILGYDTVVETLKTSNLELIILSDNLPKNRRNQIKYNAKIVGVNVKNFLGDSISLGLICGKPFPVSVVAIKGNE